MRYSISSIAVLFFLLLSPSVYAADITLTIGYGSNFPGSSGNLLTVGLDNPEHHLIKGAEITVVDDENYLSCTNCTSVPGSYYCSAQEQIDGSCKVVFYAISTASLLNGPVLKINFSVSASAPGGACRSLDPTDVKVSDDTNLPIDVMAVQGEFCFLTCSNNADCNDGNSCTDDTCVAGQCLHDCKAIYPSDPCCSNPACVSDPSCVSAGDAGPCGDVWPSESVPGANDCGDGAVDLFDVLEAMDIADGEIDPTPCQLLNGNVPNGRPPDCGNHSGEPNCEVNGGIDIFDVLVIIDKANGNENCCDFCYTSTPPVISVVKAINITSNSATIEWFTDKPSDSEVLYFTFPPYYLYAFDYQPVTSHSINLTNLLPASFYRYKVFSTDKFGNRANSVVYHFITQADEKHCFDDLDNDGDTLIDCADPDCEGAIGVQTNCGVGECAGNTGNSVCRDGSEVTNPCNPLAGALAEDCRDGLDNDCDGLSDDDDTDDCASEPTAITIASFTAEPGDGAVTLNWETGDETDNLGFNLYRSESRGGEFTKINDALIYSQASGGLGAAYTYEEDNLRNRRKYFFKLEDVDIYGVETMHGPVSATPRWIYRLER
jgi:hypothetical protein